MTTALVRPTCAICLRPMVKVERQCLELPIGHPHVRCPTCSTLMPPGWAACVRVQGADHVEIDEGPGDDAAS